MLALTESDKVDYVRRGPHKDRSVYLYFLVGPQLECLCQRKSLSCVEW